MVMMLCGFAAAAVSRFVPYSCVVVSLIYIFYLTYNTSSSQKPQTILRWQFRMGRERDYAMSLYYITLPSAIIFFSDFMR